MSRTALQWLSLVGIIWLQSINVTNTNFSAYSTRLKTLLSISQLQLNNAGKLFGWLAGTAAHMASPYPWSSSGVDRLWTAITLPNRPFIIFFFTILAGSSMISTVS
ncbi:Uncharacterized protein TCM_042253 [Theobroma cacao]|uniref:Nodulin-like domain-containing protein n=1 Tax=Theobroma cacao TaxID=3641 RepID=A0A061GYW7_THECC|nr:Uncharacterized protein TCM_042253 [Theobroma cacao]